MKKHLNLKSVKSNSLIHKFLFFRFRETLKRKDGSIPAEWFHLPAGAEPPSVQELLREETPEVDEPEQDQTTIVVPSPPICGRSRSKSRERKLQKESPGISRHQRHHSAAASKSTASPNVASRAFHSSQQQNVDQTSATFPRSGHQPSVADSRFEPGYEPVGGDAPPPPPPKVGRSPNVDNTSSSKELTRSNAGKDDEDTGCLSLRRSRSRSKSKEKKSKRELWQGESGRKESVGSDHSEHPYETPKPLKKAAQDPKPPSVDRSQKPDHKKNRSDAEDGYEPVGRKINPFESWIIDNEKEFDKLQTQADKASSSKTNPFQPTELQEKTDQEHLVSITEKETGKIIYQEKLTNSKTDILHSEKVSKQEKIGFLKKFSKDEWSNQDDTKREIKEQKKLQEKEEREKKIQEQKEAKQKKLMQEKEAKERKLEEEEKDRQLKIQQREAKEKKLQEEKDLKQQKLLQEKEAKEKKIKEEKEAKQQKLLIEKEAKEKKMQADREAKQQKLLEKEAKEKKMLEEKEIKQKRMQEEKEAKEKKIQEEKEAREKKMQEEKEAKEKKMQEEKEAKEKKMQEEKEAKEKKLQEEKEAREAKQRKIQEENEAKKKKMQEEKAAKQERIVEEKEAQEKKLQENKHVKQGKLQEEEDYKKQREDQKIMLDIKPTQNDNEIPENQYDAEGLDKLSLVTEDPSKSISPRDSTEPGQFCGLDFAFGKLKSSTENEESKEQEKAEKLIKSVQGKEKKE